MSTENANENTIPSTSASKKKTVIIGWDGATWDLLKPLAAEGLMPNLARLLEEGTHGKMESTMPAMTAPAWTTLVTGKHPGNHGIFDFMLPTNTLGEMKFATSADILDKTIYEMVADEGYSPILINLPVTYPPKRDDIPMITSLMTQGDEWIFPASLKDEFPELKNYRLTPDESLRLKERSNEYIVDLLAHLEQQMDVVKRLYTEKPWDFFFCLFSQSDWISHLDYTGLVEDGNEAGLEIFKKLDEHLGWIIEHLPENTNFMLVSDHGFKSYKKIFYFNKWLADEGYLQTNTDGDTMRGAATRRAKETDKIRAGRKKVRIGPEVFALLDKIPGAERTAKWLYHAVVKKYLPLNIKVDVGIDYANTRVCFPKGAYITNGYINKAWVFDNGCVEQDEYEELVAELVEKIAALRDPEGNPVVRRVLTRKEVYGDVAPPQAPDIFFELADYWLVGQFHSNKLFAEEVHNKHEKHGIFLGMGPDFAAGTQVHGLSIADITPTVLHTLDMAVPSDCDGRVPMELFDAGSDAAEREVRTGPSSKITAACAVPDEKASIASALGNIKL